MPHKVCIVCRHPELPAIDTALKAGVSVRSCAKRFGVSYSAIHVHHHHADNAQTRINVGSFSRIDKEIRKLHHAETNAIKRKDNAMALQIKREMRNWFTLRVKAEQVAGAQQVQQGESLTREEAINLAQALLDSEVTAGNAEIIEWLRSTLERAPAPEKRTPVIVPESQE